MTQPFGVEIGDIIVLDGTNLGIPDTKNQTKGMKPRLLEVQNLDFQLKTGDMKIEAVDTGYDGAARYGLISPSSRIKAGLSETEFLIEGSFSTRFGSSEWRKWTSLKKCSVRVRNNDFSIIGDTILTDVTSNKVTVSEPLGFVPSAGMVMEFTAYTDADMTDQAKLIYAFMRDSDFLDGKAQYQML